MSVIGKFQYDDGSHMPLSNFYPSPFYDEAGVLWPTVEHYFQAAKAATAAQREGVRLCATPGDAKREGRRVTLIANWDERRYGVMRDGLRYKFSTIQHPELVEWLLATGDALLVEGNSWGDTFWGRTYNGGHNWLGLMLMARRAELRSGEPV